jgi:predicted TPR repeat methyltransferase
MNSPDATTLNERATSALYGGLPDVAISLYKRALEQKPNDPSLLYNLANAFYAAGQIHHAKQYYKRTLKADPTDTACHYNYASILEQEGHRWKAAWHYWRLLKLDPQCTAARYRLHILLKCTPQAAPLDYVERLFDGYASSFEASLRDKLQYQGAHTLARLIIEKALPLTSGGFAHMLDLGCGTGLMGQILHHHATQLTGVDLSGAMLEEARRKNCYQHLHHAEITTFLKQHIGHFDLITSADTLPYTGNLTSFFKALPLVLAPQAIVALTVEKPSLYNGLRHGYSVTFPGRFQHRKNYILRLADKAGLECLHHESAPLRIEQGKWLAGNFYIFRKKPHYGTIFIKPNIINELFMG